MHMRAGTRILRSIEPALSFQTLFMFFFLGRKDEATMLPGLFPFVYFATPLECRGWSCLISSFLIIAIWKGKKKKIRANTFVHHKIDPYDD